MVTQAEVEKFIEVSGRAGVLDRHSQIGIAIARECLESRATIASLEAERDKAVELLREQVACHRNGGWSLKDRCEAFLASIATEEK